MLTLRVAKGVTLAAAVLAAGIACGSARARSSGESGGQYLITASELEDSKKQNLYDAVQVLRPFWLTRAVRGQSGENTVSVYINDQLVGTLSTLRRISVFGTERVSYMSATEAQTRYGQLNSGRAAIVVQLTTRPDPDGFF